MTGLYDRTLLPLSCDENVTDDDLWALHKELWKLAFTSLGDRYEMSLHELDEHVTMQPKHPELWFYRGRDDEDHLDAVSRTELRYGFPADEFNNPTFVYEVVHHWFRLGLAVAFERAEQLAASKGVRIEVPSLSQELRQTHWRLVSVGHLAQVHRKGDDISLFSAEGWTPLAELEEAYHPRVREVAASGCGCSFCARFRRRERSILERAAWEAAYSEQRQKHSGLALLGALLELRAKVEDPDRFGWALLHHAHGPGKQAVLADPEGAIEVLLPFLTETSPATAPAAVAFSGAFVVAKSKPRIAMLPLLRATLATTDEEALGWAVRLLMPDKFMAKSPVLKKHLDTALLESLATLPARVSRIPHEESWRKGPVVQAVQLVIEALVVPKPVDGAIDVVRAWLSSPEPRVRASASDGLKWKVGGYSGKRVRPFFELVVELATDTLHPEYFCVLLDPDRLKEVPVDLVAKIAAHPSFAEQETEAQKRVKAILASE